jgi:enterochelin esterase-like enzyme
LKSTLRTIGLAWIAGLIMAACAAAPATGPTPFTGTAAPGSATRQPTASSPIADKPFPTATLQPAATPTPVATRLAQATPTDAEMAELADCEHPAGHMVIASLESSLLNKPLDYRVYLPPCYEEQTGQRYPVLYLVHGQSYNDDQWDRLGADEAAGRLIAAGEIAPFILVMPRDRVWSQPDEDMFGRAVVEELIPFIDEQYRTLADRSHRAVGGLSRGAGWAVHLGLSQWKLFSAFGAHSPATFWTDALQFRTWLKEIPAGLLPRIYVDAGDHDRPEILDAAQRFATLLTQLGIPHEWYLFPGYHDEAYWSAHVEKYLRWYAEALR